MDIYAMFERIHISLRSNDLAAAERDLGLLAAILNKNATPESALIYFWYSGILKRKQLHFVEAEECFENACNIAAGTQDIFHEGRILLDLANLRMTQQRYEEAQQILDVAVQRAKQATDWITAAKAAKNRGALLSLSDKPYLGRPEIIHAIEFFERANDPDGVARTKKMLDYSQSDFLAEMLGLNLA